MPMDSILERLTIILEERRHAEPSTSYVAGLHAKGVNKILEKVGEEATEVLFEKFNAQVPLREVATPDSVARTVVWLLEDAAYTTGEMIKIDSGMHLLGFQP